MEKITVNKVVRLTDDELERRIRGEPVSTDNQHSQLATSEDFTTDDKSSSQQSANDWLTNFAKKSQEALAKRAAEKRLAPPPDEKALVEALARRDHTEYDR